MRQKINAKPNAELLLSQIALFLQAQLEEEQEPAPVPADEPQQQMDVRETAQYLRVSEWTVRDMVRTNQLPHIRIRSRIFFRRRELDKWLNEQLQGSTN